MKYTVNLQRNLPLSRDIVVDAPTAREAAQAAYAITSQLQYSIEGVSTISVDGNEETEVDYVAVVGVCEVCSAVILEGDQHHHDDDGYSCGKCML